VDVIIRVNITNISQRRWQMEKTWKPMVAGILDIVAGVLGFIAGLLVIIGMAFFTVFSTTGGMSGLQEYPPWLPVVVLLLIIPSIILAIRYLTHP
jgi:maltodextrin utilization protein YvdJ